MLISPLLTPVLLALAPSGPPLQQPATEPFTFELLQESAPSAAVARPLARAPQGAGASQRGMIGLYPGSEDEEPRISGFVPGGPAQSIGLRAGDVLVAIDGAEVEGWRDVVQAVQARRAGDTVRLRIERDGWTREFEIQLAPVPDSSSTPPPPGEEAAPEPAPGMGGGRVWLRGAPLSPSETPTFGGVLGAPPPPDAPAAPGEESGRAKVIIKVLGGDGEEKVHEFEMPLVPKLRMDAPRWQELQRRIQVELEEAAPRWREQVEQHMRDGMRIRTFDGGEPEERVIQLQPRSAQRRSAEARPELDVLRAELDSLRRELQELRQALRRMQAGDGAR